VIDEDAPHHVPGDGKEVRAALPSYPALIDHLDVGLMDEGARRERVTAALVPKVAAGDPAELRIDSLDERRLRRLFTVSPREEKRRDVRSLCHPAPGLPCDRSVAAFGIHAPVCCRLRPFYTPTRARAHYPRAMRPFSGGSRVCQIEAGHRPRRNEIMTDRMRNSIGAAVIALGLSCLGPAPAVADEGNSRLMGTWDVQLTIRNCATGAVIRELKELATFDSAGTTVSATSGVAPAAKTSGHGTWRHLSGQTYSYRFKFFTFDNGLLTGWTIVHQEARVDVTGNEYTSEGGVEVYNALGTLTFSGCSTTVSTRFE
jgi:hypothetical protein